jgi:fatty acid desaturase
MLNDVKSKQLTRPALALTFAKLLFLSVLFVATLWACWHATSWQESAIAYVVMALLLAQFAFIGHDAGHNSLSDKTSINRALGQFSMSFVTGLAFDEWIGRHRDHHKFCQDESRDPDMAVAFVVSLTEASKHKKSALGRLMTRTQPVHIWLLSFLFGHSQRLMSQASVLKSPRLFWLDALALIAHFALWFGVPCGLLDVSFEAALLTYLIPLTILGPYLAAIFWVNHIGMPVVRDIESFSFFEHQLITSRTINNPPAYNWLFGGLNFQIEHHLFPQVPSSRLHAVQTIVQTHIANCRISYHSVSWWQAMRLIAVHLRRVARA